MMVKKGYKLNKLFSFQNIIILIIACTIIFFLTHPSAIYQGKNKLKTELVKFETGDFFIPNQTDDSIYYILLQSGPNDVELRCYHYPMELIRIAQYLDTRIRFKDRFLSRVYLHEDEIYITLLKGRSEIELLTINARENSFENQTVFDLDSLYCILQDSTITKNKNKFYHHIILEDEDVEQSYIQKYKDGFRVCFTKSQFIELRKFHNYYELHTCDEYNIITKSLNETIAASTPFDVYDVYDIIYYFSALHFHNIKYFDDMQKDFLPVICKILGLNDINMDGHDDILIQVDGDRFFPKILIAYDLNNSSIIWKKWNIRI